MELKDFKQLLALITKEKKQRIAVAMAQDAEILIAVDKASQAGLADAVLIGSRSEIQKIADQQQISTSQFEIIDANNEQDAVDRAVQLVRSDEAQVLMKGLCSTALFLKGILNKEKGLRSAKVLSHFAVFESPNYKKLLFMSDAAMNIAPDLNDKVSIVQNSISALHKLGYEMPKVAMISAVEKVNPEAIPSTADAALISKMAERGQIRGAIIDGPLALDNALSPKANKVKGLISTVGGDADLCVVPNIETGNVFYKLLTVLGNAEVAGVILGAAVPVVLTSRADSDNSKFLSIASALAISRDM